jgi:hypothetical protein
LFSENKFSNTSDRILRTVFAFFLEPLDFLILQYLLTPWSRALLKKLTGFQLVKKFPAFYGTLSVHYPINMCPPPVPVMCQQFLNASLDNFLYLNKTGRTDKIKCDKNEIKSLTGLGDKHPQFPLV